MLCEALRGISNEYSRALCIASTAHPMRQPSQPDLRRILKGTGRGDRTSAPRLPQAGGNADLSARSDPHGEFKGLNCLIELRPLAVTAANNGMTVAEAAAVLAEGREVLHGIRSRRPRPHLDDKVCCQNPGAHL